VTEDPHEHHRDRLGEVQNVPGVGHDLVRVVKVGIDVSGDTFVGGIGEQGAGVRQHQWVIVDIDNLRLRGGPLRDLVGVLHGRQPGADVEELADARRGQVADDPDEELSGLLGQGDDAGELLDVGVPGLAVRGEVILAAHPVIPDSR
jgi:hypothetical protein